MHRAMGELKRRRDQQPIVAQERNFRRLDGDIGARRAQRDADPLSSPLDNPE
jgi:hypothetical protein